MSTKSERLRKKLTDKRYRDAYVASQIRVGIPFQVRAIRLKQELDQKKLAEMAGMAQPRISAIEKPGESNLNLNTLRRIASAFDVALIVRFAPFSELVRFADDFSPDDFRVAQFSVDMAELDEKQHSAGAVATYGTENNVVSIFTGKPPAQKVATTDRAPTDQIQQEAKPQSSAKTENDYREVVHG